MDPSMPGPAVTDGGSLSPSSPNPPPPPGSFGPPPPGYNYPTGRPRRNNRGIVGFFVGLGIIAVVGAGIAAAVGSRDNDSAQTSGPTVAPSTDGSVFVDPDGNYSMRVDPDWAEGPNFGGTEYWTIGDDTGGMQPLLNVTSTVEADPSVEDFLDMGDLDISGGVEMIDARTVKSATGEELARMEYLVSPAVGADLHFLALVEVDGATVNVATFAAPADRFELLRPEVEPYMLTLAPN